MPCPDNALIAETIKSLTAARTAGKTICPSEVARALAAPNEWRQLMQPIRAVARQLAKQGVVVITQRGRIVDPDNFKGAIRIRQLAPESQPPEK